MTSILKKYFYHTLFFSLALFPLYGEDNSYKEELIQNALDKKLYEKRDWILLGHYEKLFTGDYKSNVDDEIFFISENGKYSPKDELVATVRSLFEESFEGNSSLRSRCIFTARYDWLKSELEIDENRLERVECDRFNKWWRAVNGDEVTLIFPASYINNPSSMFGHTLMRVDKKGETNHLLSYALHYSASTGDDGGVAFAVKGIFGGYPAYFSVIPYFEKVNSYSDLEDRDIWEYKLNFSPEETRRMLLHAWEMHFFYTDYFFFRENCAYTLLFMLEYARPSLNLRTGYMFWAIPSDTIKDIFLNNDVVESVEYRPSKSSSIKNLINQSSDISREIALKVYSGELSPSDILSMEISDIDKYNALDIAYEYTDYKRLNGDIEHEKATKKLLPLLIARSRLGKREVPIEKSPVPETAPHYGHRTSRVSIGGGVNGSGESITKFTIRPSYHTVIDSDRGFSTGSEIIFFNLDYEYNSDKQSGRVNRFDILKILSLSPSDQFFRTISWGVDVTIKQNLLSDDLIYQLKASSGISYGDKYRAFILGNTQFLHSQFYEKRSDVAFGLDVGILMDFKWSKIVIETDAYKHMFNSYGLFSNAKVLANIFTGEQHSILVEGSYEKVDYERVEEDAKLSVSFGYFF
jgi:hypothetical protein